MTERINAGYTIVESVTVGDTEFVLAENPKAPDPYVTWRCNGGADYNWGRYFRSYHQARTNLFERALERAKNEEASMLSDATPSNSPWGKVYDAEKLCSGVFSVSTASHGGIMAEETRAPALFSPAALKCGFRDAGYYCFEEDRDAPVAIRELLDKKKMVAPVNESYAPGEYARGIDNSVRQFHPEYWNDRQRRMEFAARNKRAKERER